MSIKREALSDSWRVDPSSVMAIDLANVLRSLRKVIGAVDDRACNVSFNSHGESHFNPTTMHIKIDPKHAIITSPVDGANFDILAGHAVHEALHSKCCSDLVTYDKNDTIENAIVTIGEEIYIDNFGKRTLPVLGQYIHRGREAYTPDSDNVAWDNIFLAWGTIAIYGVLPPDMGNFPKMDQLKLLMDLSEVLRNRDLGPNGRSALYQETAVKIKAMQIQDTIEENLKKQPPPPLELDAPHGVSKQQMGGGTPIEGDKENEKPQDSPEGEGKGKGKEEGEEPQPGEGEENKNTEDDEDESQPNPTDFLENLHPQGQDLPTELTMAINQVLELDTEDVTAIANEKFTIKGNDSIIWSKTPNPIDTNFNERLAKELSWIREYKNTTGHQTYRNEPRGKLDPRKLYKAPINGLVFTSKHDVPKNDLKLVMLLDASGSMSSSLSIYEDAKALFKALPDSVILSYDNAHGTVNINLHTQGRILREVEPGGGTPSGVALAITAMKYPHSLIIHFTDGGSNSGDTPDMIIPQIHEKYPAVKIVNVQMNSRTLIRDVEGVSRSMRLDNVYEFPKMLKEILRGW